MFKRKLQNVLGKNNEYKYIYIYIYIYIQSTVFQCLKIDAY